MRVFRTADRADAQALADAMNAKQGLPKVSRRADGRPSPHAAAAQAYLSGPRTGKPPPGVTLEEKPRRVGDTAEWEVPVLERHRADIVGLRFSGRTLRDVDLSTRTEPIAEPTRETAEEEPTR